MKPRRSCWTRAALIACIALALNACAADSLAPEAAPTAVDAEGAKNVILFIGDGMGVATVTAARIFDGQSRGLAGEEHQLAFERFPNVALVKTYNTNQQVPDSAGTASAMLTGQKTRAGVINIGPTALRAACGQSKAHQLTPLTVFASRQGMATGVVTTARLTHATPATTYAHSPERNWESDDQMPAAEREAGCADIARQLVDDPLGAGLDVAMGGGARHFYGSDHGGVRLNPEDDLAAEWQSAADRRVTVRTADELAAVDAGQQVLGLFARSHMTYVAEREADSTEPELAQMALKAIELLSGDPEGYFLMVESGRIDHGHHDGKPGYALTETQAFANTVEAVLEEVDLSETLVLVTADHSHVFTMGGYPTRGNPILGLVVNNDGSGEPKDEPDIAADGQPYTTLGYYNGPGAISHPRPRPEVGISATAQATIPIQYEEPDGSFTHDESHGGEDVALYGTGPGAEDVRGVIEQNRIYDIMTDALGWDDR